MIGPEGLVTAVDGLLRARLPGKLAEFRGLYGVGERDLEDVQRFLTHEPDDIAIDRPPMIVTVEQESDITDGPMLLGSDGGGGATYEFHYWVSVYAWARGTSHQSTALARQRYGLAVREVLFQTPGIGPGDPGLLVIDPTTLREQYSGVATSPDSRETIAATVLLVQYRAQEYLGPRLPDIGAVAGIDSGVGVEP